VLWLLLACEGEAERSPSLADDAFRTLLGTSERPYGEAVFNLGDLDGDGADDLGVAWVPERDVDDSAGRLDVFTAAGHVATILDEVGGGWLVATGECSTPRVPGNLNVTPVGDLDNDGLEDLAVAFPRLGNGRVAIFGGDQLRDGQTLASTDAARWLSPDGSTWSFGSDLAVGDLDGDARPDLVIGAPITDAPIYAGEAYVFLGSDLRNAEGEVAGEEEAMRFATNDQGLHLGERVALIGDVDEDGLGDVALLASACSRSEGDGFVSIVPGSFHVGGGHRTTANLAEWRRTDPRFNLLPIGDADGDGLPDLAIGGVPDEDGAASVVVLRGVDMGAGGVLEDPPHRFYTGADSRTMLASWVVDGAVEVLGYDGAYIVRVADPVWARGWYKSESWTTPCPTDAVEPWRRQLAVGDFDGDGEDEIAFAEPGWPDCEGSQPGAVFLVQ